MIVILVLLYMWPGMKNQGYGPKQIFEKNFVVLCGTERLISTASSLTNSILSATGAQTRFFATVNSSAM